MGVVMPKFSTEIKNPINTPILLFQKTKETTEILIVFLYLFNIILPNHNNINKLQQN